jgi:hypothetical protein
LQRGYHLVCDYQSDQLGVQEPTTNGMMLVEGAWYCPSMPADLIFATHDYWVGDRKMGKQKKSKTKKPTKTPLASKSKPSKSKKTKKPRFKIDLETYVQRIEARRNYLLRLKDCTGVDDRWPSVTANRFRFERPMASLASSPSSMTNRSTKKSMRWSSFRCCASKAAFQNPRRRAASGCKTFSMSDEWHGVYSTLRNTIEGTNGVLKNGCYEGLGDSRRRPTRGIAAATLFSAVLIWAANLRRIYNFFAQAEPSANHDVPFASVVPRSHERVGRKAAGEQCVDLKTPYHHLQPRWCSPNSRARPIHAMRARFATSASG